MTDLRRPARRSFWNDVFAGLQHRTALRAWEKAGRAGPAPLLYQQQVILAAAAGNGAKVFVETRTHFGDLARALADKFREVYTMESDDDLYERAKKKFDPRPHIHCLGGASPELLASILRRISEPCVFLLNAHAPDTAGPPRVDQELAAIAAHRVKTHAVLIDHTSRLTGAAGLPTPEQIDSLRASLFPALRMTVEHDIVRLLPTG